MEIPFIPGIIIALIINLILARFWCKIADWIGTKIGLKKIIAWILKRLIRSYV